MTPGRHTGRIIHTSDRGYGFVAPDRDGPAIYLHVSQYAGTWPPAIGQAVAYALTAGPRGLAAADCTPTD